jgi:oxygen-independent coproporphyrinogen-3 oxidase
MVSGAQERTRRAGEPVALRTADGALLCGDLLLPPAGQPPTVAIALSHAMMVDRRTLDQPPGEGLLSQLVAAGAAVLWFDQRGHGKSAPLPRSGASWDYDALVDDAGVVADYLAQRFPDLPRVAVGHSLFGHVALAWQATVAAGWSTDRDTQAPPAKRVGYDGLVLIGANVWLPQLEPLRPRWWLKQVTFAVLVAASAWRGYLPVRDLRMGSADEPYAYLRQMGAWLGQHDWTARDGRSYLHALSAVRVPILSVASVGDRLLAVPTCQLRLAGQTQGPVTHINVGRAWGDPCEPDHMGLVLDSRMAPVWRQIAAWTRSLARRPAPQEPVR